VGTMQIISQLTSVGSCEPAVITIGFFDGVHRGHQHVIRRVAEFAVQQRARAVLVTFWPHPQCVLHPEKPKPLLTTLQEKLGLLAAQGGLDMVVAMPFTEGLPRLTPREYLELLRISFQLRTLIVGADFALGHNRIGDITWLQNAGKELGFNVKTFTISAGESRISSTRIRELIASGCIEEATDLLGRPYTLVGTVIQGSRSSRELGFPTANLALDPVKILPTKGVYAVRVQLPDDQSVSRRGVAYVGMRPNFEETNPVAVEVHLLDVHFDLSGQQLGIEFVAWIREEQPFHSTQARQAQMKADVDQARRLLTTTLI
jgi:riboflavin kinase/FMN adenylyltransferase